MTNNINQQLTELGMKTHWNLNRAATIVFGSSKDKSDVLISQQGNQKKSTRPSKAVDVNSMKEKELNNMFQIGTGETKRIKRALGIQTVGRQISFDTLYEYWKDTMKSQWGTHADPPEFPAWNEMLKDLWRQLLFEDDRSSRNNRATETESSS